MALLSELCKADVAREPCSGLVQPGADGRELQHAAHPVRGTAESSLAQCVWSQHTQALSQGESVGFFM